MLCRRKIELNKNTPGLPQILIPQETLVDCGKANKLLQHAHEQADELLRQATEECNQRLENAGLAFWQRANAQLSRWEHERQDMLHHLEKTAATIVNHVIGDLLKEAIPEQRLAILLRQLLLTQIPAVKATLLCHPLEREDLERCLAHHPPMPWNLHSNEDLKPQSLVLETEEGAFHINWASMIEALSVSAK
ncbi:HrpE/YscL family type III secretion apparatus protein [Pseudomonas sp. CCM 7893]|uniref:HrpE/YscL family type III secretion apparatus protein n=1 Tax=Pseudomonas spelaei TaxID=1055469 RepID=A0A6I3VZV3_9PSED|nr:type III secretion system stator protein SctL [Pseudomonas spelaei]MUF03465.1 HrpE/YscL family type III secretion apparatus protein [Pseudomonas spelaei]